MTKRFLFYFLICVFVAGCASTGPERRNPPSETSQPRETRQDEVKALKSVAEAISGQELSDKDMRQLSNQIQKDEKAQSAIRAVTGALGGQKVVVKYCPNDGKRYSAHLEYCPDGKTPLKIVE
jgi:hypothetical protein